MIITLGGLPIDFIDKPSVTDDLDSSGGTFEFTVLGSAPKPFGQIVTIRTIKSGQIYKGIYVSGKISPGPPRKTTLRCAGMDYLTECKVLYGVFAGDANDVLRNLCDMSGIQDILGYPVSPVNTYVELELNGEYLRQALDLFCQNTGTYWRVTTDQGLLEIFLPDSSNNSPHDIVLPFHNCNNEQQLLDLDFENTPNAFSTVIVAGKNAPLEYSSVTLNTRIEDVITQLQADDNNKIFQLLDGATRIVYVDVTPKSISGGAPLLSLPLGIAFDSIGNCYFCDTNNNRVRKISTTGIISTVAGDGNFEDTGDGGSAISARITPAALVINSTDEIIIGTQQYRIRKIDISGNISTIAGNGVQGDPPTGDGGNAISATLYGVTELAINSIDEVFITDSNFPVRFIDGSGIIDMVTDGGLDTYPNIQYLSFDYYGTELYFTDRPKIYKLTGGVITHIAGTGIVGYTGDGGLAVDADIESYTLTLDMDGNIYFCSLNYHVIRKIDTFGNISTIAGTGMPGYSGDGGLAVDAELYFPLEITYYNNAIYFGDQAESCIRKIDLITGNISLFAGTPGTTGFGGDGGPAIP